MSAAKKVTSDDAPAMIKLSAIYAQRASQKGIDTTRAAKLVRGKMRANFAKVCELSPNVTLAKHDANDGNRWPVEVTRELAEFILGATPAPVA